MSLKIPSLRGLRHDEADNILDGRRLQLAERIATRGQQLKTSGVGCDCGGPRLVEVIVTGVRLSKHHC